MLDIRCKENTDGTTGSAIFSSDRMYRYALARDWNKEARVICWIMLNPSIGSETLLENTTLGCMKRSKMWGYSGMVVVNLFAYIATDPLELKAAKDPVGPNNDETIKGCLKRLPEDITIVAAWGNHGKLRGRDKQVVELLSSKKLFCLGENKDGTPRHPLHLSHSIPPKLWKGAK